MAAVLRLAFAALWVIAGCAGDGRQGAPTRALEARALPSVAAGPRRLHVLPTSGEAMDGYPVRRFLLDGAGPTRALGLGHHALLRRDGVLILRPDGRLLLERTDGGSELLLGGARPELAFDPLTERLAIVVSDGEVERLVQILPGQKPAPLAGPYLHLDRPALLGGDLVLFVAATGGHLPGLFALRHGQAPRQLTNEGLPAGYGLPPSFVPPPATAASLRRLGEAIVYCDGEVGWRIDLGGAPPRRDPRGCEGVPR